MGAHAIEVTFGRDATLMQDQESISLSFHQELFDIDGRRGVVGELDAHDVAEITY